MSVAVTAAERTATETDVRVVVQLAIAAVNGLEPAGFHPEAAATGGRPHTSGINGERQVPLITIFINVVNVAAGVQPATAFFGSSRCGFIGTQIAIFGRRACQKV